MRRKVLFVLALASMSTGCLKWQKLNLAPIPVVAVQVTVPDSAIDSVIAKSTGGDAIDSHGPHA